MTRINVGMLPSELTTKHLIAEHREIVRIPNCIKKGRYCLKNQPEKFTLGKGHVKFFYTRIGYLQKRYEALYARCIELGYKVTYFGNSFKDIPLELMNDYTPTTEDIAIIKQRINEKLNK